MSKGPDWKQKDRDTAKLADMGFIHSMTDAKPGDVKRFATGVYMVSECGGLKRLTDQQVADLADAPEKAANA